MRLRDILNGAPQKDAIAATPEDALRLRDFQSLSSSTAKDTTESNAEDTREATPENSIGATPEDTIKMLPGLQGLPSSNDLMQQAHSLLVFAQLQSMLMMQRQRSSTSPQPMEDPPAIGLPPIS